MVSLQKSGKGTEFTHVQGSCQQKENNLIFVSDMNRNSKTKLYLELQRLRCDNKKSFLTIKQLFTLPNKVVEPPLSEIF